MIFVNTEPIKSFNHKLRENRQYHSLVFPTIYHTDDVDPTGDETSALK